MASFAPSASALNTSAHSGWKWFAEFLRQELAPFPGRGWTVARMTVTATVVMLCIMVFRMPNAALGAYFTLLFSRDSAGATIRSVLRTVSAVGVSLLYIMVTVRLFAGDPLLHFMWVAGTLFITFFLISALSEYLIGTAFGFLAVTSIASWDFPANTGLLVENTLWTALAVVVGAVVTTAIELLARHIHPADQFTDQLLDRIDAVEDALRSMVKDRPFSETCRQKLEQYSMTGTASLRQHLALAPGREENVAEMSAAVALTGRLVDLTAHVVSAIHAHYQEDREGLRAAANQLEQIRIALRARNAKAIANLETRANRAATGSFLADIQSTLDRFPEVFSGFNLLADYLPSSIDFDQPKRLFRSDAFTSVNHLQFALKGTLAALSCYLIYNSIQWRGLSSSVATCMITALTTVGSSRQKQLLRVAGAILGGIVIGIPSQIFLLPHMDGIADFTLLFAAVTAVSCWIGTSSPRISYAGVQTAFAFYITHLRVFGPQISLKVARDDVLGILFGLIAMWLTYDQIWAKDSRADMLDVFVANIRRIARFDHLRGTDLRSTLNLVRAERAAINGTFDQIRNISDSLIFEFGTGWQKKVHARDQVRRWQPQLRTYFILQVGLMHYRLQRENRELTPQIEQNLKRSEAILLLLADLQQETQAQRAAEIQQQVDTSTTLFDEPKGDEIVGNAEMSHALSLSRSMLEVAGSLATQMKQGSLEGL